MKGLLFSPCKETDVKADQLENYFSGLYREEISLRDSRTWFVYTDPDKLVQLVFDAVKGKDYGTREDYFNFYVVYSPFIEGHVAQCVYLALRSEKLVYLVTVYGVEKVIKIQSPSYGKVGWEVITVPLEEN